jgi:hypothetical protein
VVPRHLTLGIVHVQQITVGHGADLHERWCPEPLQLADVRLTGRRITAPRGDQEQRRRTVGPVENDGLHGELVRCGDEDLTQLLEHRGGLRQRVSDHAGEHAVDGMEPDAHGRHDAEVATATANGPEQFGLVIFVHRDQPAVGEDEIGAEQVVDGQAEAAARVSPATVYVIGGKQGLLRILVDQWSAAPEVDPVRRRLEEIEDATEIMRVVARLTRQMREGYGDIMRVVLATAPHDPTVAESLAVATGRYRDGTAVAARRLSELGALRDSVDTDEALDILWFYFGYAGFFTLVDDNGWSYARAERWLLDAAGHALLRPRSGHDA